MGRAMKDSGVEWIGEIPEGWGLRRLRYLCNISTGNQDTQDNDPEGEYPFYVRSPIVEHSKRWTFEGPAILMAGDGAGAGKVFHYVDGKYGCHQRVYSMQAFNDSCRRFIFYYLQNNFWVAIENANSKSTVDSVRLPMLQDFWVPMPEISEQTRIANYLDTQCAHIGTVIEKTKASIEEYKKLKQEVITQAVTKGVRGERKMKDSGIEWIGEIPEEWEVTTVLKKIDFIGGSQPPLTSFIHEEREGYVRLIQNRDYKTDAYITFVPVDSVTKFCEVDDVMIGRYGPPVFVMHRGLKGAYNVALMKAVPKGIAREWMYYFLQETTMLEYIKSFSKRAAGQDGVDTKILKNYPMVVPDNAEQLEIAEYLSEKCKAIDVVIAKKESFLSELESYKKSLIYEYVTGKKEVPES